jgi:phosphoribosylformimino-5-aminoimidazole carboxamide ribotide isomerase
MQIIPSIDLWQGQVVRLRQGRYDQVTVYGEDPVAVARGWQGAAATLHVVDLAGAQQGRAVQTELIRSIVAAFGPGVQVGGGVRSLETLHGYFALGVERVVLGTAAVDDPELIRAACAAYPGRVVVALDAKGGYVAARGWSEVSGQRAVDLARSYQGLPIAALLYTDIERDGTEVGPNIAATAALARESGFDVLASGGVGTLEHVRQLAQASAEVAGKIRGVILGRALHERRFTVAEASAVADRSGG